MTGVGKGLQIRTHFGKNDFGSVLTDAGDAIEVVAVLVLRAETALQFLVKTDDAAVEVIDVAELLGEEEALVIADESA
jgi:hypothetical protein